MEITGIAIIVFAAFIIGFIIPTACNFFNDNYGKHVNAKRKDDIPNREMRIETFKSDIPKNFHHYYNNEIQLQDLGMLLNNLGSDILKKGIEIKLDDSLKHLSFSTHEELFAIAKKIVRYEIPPHVATKLCLNLYFLLTGRKYLGLFSLLSESECMESTHAQ